MHERTRVANHPKAEQGLCQPVTKVMGPQCKCQGCWERGSEGGLDDGFSGGLGQNEHTEHRFRHACHMGPGQPECMRWLHGRLLLVGGGSQ